MKSAPLPAARAAAAPDYATFVRLFPELGVDDPVPSPAQFEARMLPRMVVLEDGGEALGYGFWQAYGRTAHVVQIVVDPRARGRGAGRAIMEAVRERAVAEGCTRWYLNVKQDNAPAKRLYEQCGLAVEQEGWATATAWSQLASLPDEDSAHASPAHRATPYAPSPDEDPALAARFGLDPERLAPLRARGGVVVLALREPAEHGEPVAFAAFDPAFPGVYPVRVTRVGLARPLFDALRPHAREDRVLVFVEGDRALYEAVAAAGAELRHALYRMGAAIG